MLESERGDVSLLGLHQQTLRFYAPIQHRRTIFCCSRQSIFTKTQNIVGYYASCAQDGHTCTTPTINSRCVSQVVHERIALAHKYKRLGYSCYGASNSMPGFCVRLWRRPSRSGYQCVSFSRCHATLHPYIT